MFLSQVSYVLHVTCEHSSAVEVSDTGVDLGENEGCYTLLPAAYHRSPRFQSSTVLRNFLRRPGTFFRGTESVAVSHMCLLST